MTQIPSEDQPERVVPHKNLDVPGLRTSKAAIASLILGVLLCVPMLSGLGAILFAAVGIRATREGLVRGRGIAIAGLTLGITSLLSWTGLGAMLTLGWFQTSSDRAITTAFVHDLDAGDLSTAQAKCGSHITTKEIQKAADYLKTLGTLNSYTNNTYRIYWHFDGTATAVISGTATCSDGVHAVSVTFFHPSQGTPIIQGYNIR